MALKPPIGVAPGGCCHPALSIQLLQGKAEHVMLVARDAGEEHDEGTSGRHDPWDGCERSSPLSSSLTSVPCGTSNEQPSRTSPNGVMSAAARGNTDSERARTMAERRAERGIVQAL